MGPLLSLHDVAAGYRRGPPIVSGVTCDLSAGTLACVLGPNGSGKSTLLRTLTRLQKPLAGRIEYSGKSLQDLTANELARTVSVVLTERLAPMAMTGYELVRLGRLPYTGWAGSLTPEDLRAVDWAIEETGVHHLVARDVHEMSDGERQRVFVARALAQQPAVMILDEPSAFLDVPNRAGMMGLLKRLAHESGLAVLLSTHDLDLAMRTADVVWLIPGDGSVSAASPESVALDGRLIDAFPAQSDFFFDMEEGRYRVASGRGATASVQGTGTAAVWTERLVERLGLRAPTAEVANLTVRVWIDNARTVWNCSGPDGDAELHNISEVEAWLRNRAD